MLRFAENSVRLTEIPPDMSHPQWIRRWFSEQDATQGLPPELQEVTPEPSLRLPQRDAERVAKTILRAQSGCDFARG